jgi:signal transduction histidine kinase
VAVLYVAFAVAILAALSRQAASTLIPGSLVPVVDLVAAAGLTLLSNLAVVHFLPLFVLVSTAYRAGVAQTIASGALLAGILALERGPAVTAVAAAPQLRTHLVVLAGYTLVTAVLIGHLAQRERGARSESIGMARLFERLRLDAGPVASLTSVLRELREMFGARQVVLAVDDAAEGLSFVWRSRAARGASSGPVVERLSPAARARYWFPAGGFAGACLVARAGGAVRVVAAVDERGDEASAPAFSIQEFADAHEADRLMVLPNLSVNGFRIRLVVLDPCVERAAAELQLLQTLARRIIPVLHNLYLERHVRTRLQEDERARLARELHDGVIQSLVAIEMRLDVARRRVESAPAAAAEDLGAAQRQLRGQIVDVRTLMNQLRPPDVDRHRLAECLSDTTERFRQTTGIEARFEREVDQLALPARVCGELVRVVDEALMNVRKHSGARRVDVRLGAAAGALTLSIEDDGRGFGFHGRLTQSDLDARGLGPLVIKERVNALGGRFAIDSVPGRGARLEVQVPTPAPG